MFGVRQVELFHNADGKVYCLLDAPDADAVVALTTLPLGYPAVRCTRSLGSCNHSDRCHCAINTS